MNRLTLIDFRIAQNAAVGTEIGPSLAGDKEAHWPPGLIQVKAKRSKNHGNPPSP